MKASLIIILSLSFTLSILGQQDSSFTKIAEAKNQTVKGLKEGRWFEILDEHEHLCDPNAQNIFWAGHYQLSTYNAGKYDGVVRVYNGGGKYYTDGKLESETPYSNGKKNGVMKEYHYDGQVEREVSYINDMMNGEMKEYYDTGMVVEYNVRHGSVKYLHHTKKSVKNEYSYKNNKLDGICKDYYESGVLEDEKYYIRGYLKNEKYYYENGNLESETDYTHNSMGITTDYDKKGHEIK